MAGNYLKNGDFALIFENRERRNERDADMQGHGEVKCPKCGHMSRFWVNAWAKVSPKAGKFFSIAFRSREKPKEEQTMPWE